MSYSVNQDTLVATYNGVEYQPKSVDGVMVAPTEADCIEFATTGQVNNQWQANNGYKLSRAAEYPSLAEQLDYIYHNGVDAWKTDMIDPIKQKYPKPE